VAGEDRDRHLGSGIARALRDRGTWSTTRVEDLVREIAHTVVGSHVDWDLGAGENWARVLLGDDVCALVSAEMPLVILRASLAGGVDSGPGVEVVTVDNFHAREHEIDAGTAEALGVTVPLAQFDRGAFSVMDLWWATV
jgi:hypothetical protein